MLFGFAASIWFEAPNLLAQGAQCGGLAAKSPIPYSSFESAAYKHVVIGQIYVPRLRLSAAMAEGDDEESFSLAAGHLTGTAPTGSEGNTM
jgi:sortase (surface protein transpeptidase)